MLKLSNISKSFDGVMALDAVNLDTEESKTTVLIGLSACGKSTLLRIMIELIRPDHGSTRFEDLEVMESTAPSLRKKMGYVIHDGVFSRI